MRTFYIRKLELTNFMRFEHSVFDFAQDLTLVVGQNGTGKSAILEALALSFQIKERASSIAEYIRHGQTKGSIKLECVWLNEPLTIETTFSGKRTHRVVTHKDVTYEDSQASSYLSTFFDNRSLTIAFAMQGNERFLSSSKTTNLKNLTNLLQLDFTKELNSVKSQVQTLETTQKDTLAELNRHSGMKDVNSQNIQNYEARIVNLTKEIETTLVPTDEALSETEKKLVELNVELQKLIETKNSVNQKYTEWQNSRNLLNNSQLELTGLEKQINELPVNLQLQDNSKFLELQNKLPEELTKLKTNLTDCNTKITEIHTNISRIQTQRNFELDRQQKLKDGICPTCLQKVSETVSTDLTNKVAQLENELNALQDNLNKLSQDKNKCEQDIDNKNLDISKNSEDLRKVESNNAQVEHVKTLRESLNKSKESLVARIEQLKTATDELMNTYNQVSTIDDDKITKLQSEIQMFNSNKTRIQNEISAHQAKITEKSNLALEIERLKKDLEVVDVVIDTKTKELQKAQESLDVWQKVNETFKMLPKVHLQSFIEEVQNICSLVVSQFGYRGVRIDSDEDSKGIDFYLQDWSASELEAVETPYNMCSAFEKNLVNLALVYTLSRLFRVPFICIDELDASADTENTLKLGLLIEMILKYTTVVSVSHDTNLVSELLQKSYDILIIKTEVRRERPTE